MRYRNFAIDRCLENKTKFRKCLTLHWHFLDPVFFSRDDMVFIPP
jgi:hypothetical protein